MHQFLSKCLLIVFFSLLGAESFASGNPSVDKPVITNQDIRSVMLQPQGDGIYLTWFLDYSILPTVSAESYTISIAYADVSDVTNEKLIEKSKWTIIKDISIDSTSYTIKTIGTDKTIALKVGLVSKENEIIWSETVYEKTNPSWGIFSLFVLIGSLGLFLYGMKIMSESIQQAAGSKMRSLLESITSNRVKGVFTGMGITSIIQSSSVTTVMTVSFVNAGLLTLSQSAGVMMGANIGTTVTAWFVNLLGFQVNISSYVIVLIGIAIPFVFISKTKLKSWANALIGFALLFLGLEFLKDSVPVLSENSPFVQFFVAYKDIPFFNTFLFVLFGALLTMIIQSSSAAMALTMTLVASGVMPFEAGAAMVLGENIGTTITAEIAATIGNVHAKRSARIHSLFNLIGVSWMLLIFNYYLDGIAWCLQLFGLNDPFLENELSAVTGLALLHTSFNVLNCLILIWFVPQLIALATKTVKSRGDKDEKFHLDYIGSSIMTTPDLSILEVKKELVKFGNMTYKMSNFTKALLFEKNELEIKKLLDRITKYEEITDRLEVEIANYLNKVSEGELSEEIASRIRGMNSIANDLERIGDIFYQMSKALEHKHKEKFWFTPEQRNRLSEMFDLVEAAFIIMNENLSSHKDSVVLDDAKNAEKLINIKRNELRNDYLNSLSDSATSNFRAGIIYNDLFASLEKVGDHIINVSEAIVGEI